jgi:hypothetical protein
MQFSLWSLVVLSALIGAGMLALVNSSEWLASGVFTFVIAAWCVALHQSLFSKGPHRAAWSAFAFSCGAYLLLSMGPWCDEHVGKHLLTTRVLDSWHATLPSDDSQSMSQILSSGVVMTVPAGRYYFLLEGHAIIGLIVGWIAAMLSLRRPR